MNETYSEKHQQSWEKLDHFFSPWANIQRSTANESSRSGETFCAFANLVSIRRKK